MAAISEDDKKKLYVLGGLLGILAVGGGVMYLPGMLSGGGDTVDTPVTPAAPPATGASPATEGAAPAEASGGAAPVAQAAGFSLLAAESARRDPFMPIFRKVQPQALRIIAPRPPRPVNVTPSPISLPLPGAVLGDVSLPPFSPLSSGSPGISLGGPRQAASRFGVLAGLPRANIAHVSRDPGQPDIARIIPPPRTGGRIAEAIDPDTIRESTNKRLSGVIIGDGIHAILEISNGVAGPTISRVVQPGDVVDGIKIVRIERYTEGGQTGTRMLISEGGQELWVELKAAPQPIGQGALAGIAPMGATSTDTPPISLTRTGALPSREEFTASPRRITPRGNSSRTENRWGPPPPP